MGEENNVGSDAMLRRVRRTLEKQDAVRESVVVLVAMRPFLCVGQTCRAARTGKRMSRQNKTAGELLVASVFIVGRGAATSLAQKGKNKTTGERGCSQFSNPKRYEAGIHSSLEAFVDLTSAWIFTDEIKRIARIGSGRRCTP